MTATPSSATTVHVVVTCASRKRRPVPHNLRMQSVRRRRVEGRFETWVQRLTTSDEPALPAEQLYGGEHWQIALGLGRRAAEGGHDARTWVCSAGYGLVPITAPLRPYAATFASGHPDSVADTTADLREWWDHQAAWAGPKARAPRSLTALANRNRQSTLLVVLSGTYLRACAHDVLGAAERLRRPEQLSIISSPATVPAELREFTLPADARLQGVLGGSLQALNVRVADHVLRQAGSHERPALAEYLAALARGRVRPKPNPRTPMTDADVHDFIRARWVEGCTHSGLLRQLRDAGFACEQHRFARLFAAAQRSH